MPGRWLLRGLIAWILSPAVVFFLVIIGETLTRPPVDDALGKAFFGFMLIASIMAIPWLVLCLLGFGIGMVLRRRFRRPPDAPDRPGTPARKTASSTPEADAEDTHQERFGLDPSRASGIRARSAPRYIATGYTGTHRFFLFLDASVLPDDALVAIGIDDPTTRKQSSGRQGRGSRRSMRYSQGDVCRADRPALIPSV